MAVKSLISFILSGLLFLPAFYTSSAAAKATTTKGELTVQDCDPLNEHQKSAPDCFKFRVKKFCKHSADKEACRGEQRLKYFMTDREYELMLSTPQDYFDKFHSKLELQVELPTKDKGRIVAALLGYKSLAIRGYDEYVTDIVNRCGVTFKLIDNRITCAEYAGIKCANRKYSHDTCTLAEDNEFSEFGDDKYEFSNDSGRVLL